jgi:hypothetical protein
VAEKTPGQKAFETYEQTVVADSTEQPLAWDALHPDRQRAWENAALAGGELERYEQSPAELETEFGSYPEEIRRAALEYARGLVRQDLSPSRQEVPGDEEVQFILVGVEQAGRALLFASTSVTETKFARWTDGFDRVQIRPGGPVARVPRMFAIVGAKMTSFEQIVGDDYREALASLVREWDRKQRRSSRACPCSQMSYGHTYNDHDEQRRQLGPGEAK